jgi:RNA polymerase sigma-70 factor (ECF subfamily)
MAAMTGVGTFRDLIKRVRAGDEAAATELVRLYEPAIRRAARIRLADSNLRRLFDSMDISQSVFASFFLRAALGQYELEAPEQLLKLLVTMSRKKLTDHLRQQHAACRDCRRDTAAGLDSLIGRADPGRQVATRELLREARRRLSADERRLADLRAGGRRWEQVAQELGGRPEALRKQLSRAIERVARELSLDDFDHV